MKLLVTGSRGFLGTNLRRLVDDAGRHSIIEVTRSDSLAGIRDKLQDADFVFHFAGVNRAERESDYTEGNARLTERVCELLAANRRAIPLLLASSAQAATEDNAYARSKREAEGAVATYAATTGATSWVCRLPNLFGPWARPDYNSVVATFCFNVSRGRPIVVHEPSRELVVADVRDAVASLLECVDAPAVPDGLARPGLAGVGWMEVHPRYRIRLAHLASVIRSFGGGDAAPVDAVADEVLISKLRSTYRWYEIDGHVFDA